MAKKDLQVGQCYFLSSDREENPKLGAKLLGDGRESLFLDFYFGYEMVYNNEKDQMEPKKKRRRENLKLYLWHNPRTPQDRQDNKDTLILAKKIRYDKGQELLDQEKGYRLQTKRKSANLLDYFQTFADNANVKDKQVLLGSLRNFKDFLKEEYPQFASKLEAKNLSKEMVVKFVDFLVDNHKGQGAETYYRRFKRLVNYAVEQGEISKSPCKGINTPKVDDILSKDILSQEEMQQLFATHYVGENKEIRRAFAFTCMTGVRRCDVVELSYSNIDYSNRLLKFRQSKTSHSSSKSGVTIPLNDTLLALIGTKQEGANDDYIFHLPSDTMCLKALRTWTKKAGISKHITWHCGRHSFATAVLSNGANIKVVADLLGHSNLKFTEIYVRAVDELKREAINSLPKIEL